MWRNPVGEGAKRVTTGVLDPGLSLLAPTRAFSTIAEMATAPSIAILQPQRGWPALVRLREALERWLEAERDQLALWAPVGFGAGIALWFLLPDRPAWIALLLGCGGVALAAMAIGRGGRAGPAVAAFALFAAAGCGLVWGRAEMVGAPPLARTAIIDLTARVVRVEPLPAKAKLRLELAPIAAPTLPPRVRLTLDVDKAPAGVGLGAVIRVRARLVPPPGPAVPGAYDYRRIAWFNGLGATGGAMGAATIVSPAPAVSWRTWLDDARGRLTAHIEAKLAGAAGGIAAALATGDEGAIPQSDSDAMRQSGLAHLLSVSGLHLSAVVAVVMLLTLRLLALSPRLALRLPLLLIAGGVAALAGVAYTLMTGYQVPTVRSCVAALLVLGGIALGREAVTLRLVAAGALIVMLIWPESEIGPSFQMSFAAIAAIVALHEHPAVRGAFAKRDESWLRGLLREGAALLVTGLVVELALMPIALFHFHRAGIYGSLANIVAIPLTTFVIMPAEALALLLDPLGAGGPLWWVAGRALQLLLWIAHHVGAVRTLPAMPTAAFALMVAGGMWIALWRTRPRWIGLAPLAIGALWAVVTPAPDLLITGDGRHLGLREPDGAIALLRDRTGDYVRSTLNEISGRAADEVQFLADMPNARCGPDLCVAEVERGGRRWRLLATRSTYRIDVAALNAACAAADIIVSDRRLPRGCTPRWIKADPSLLARTGGLAIDLAHARVTSVADADGAHPWVPIRGGVPIRSGVPVSSGAAARRAYPAPVRDRRGSAAARTAGSPDRAAPSPPRGGNI